MFANTLSLSTGFERASSSGDLAFAHQASGVTLDAKLWASLTGDFASSRFFFSTKRDGGVPSRCYANWVGFIYHVEPTTMVPTKISLLSCAAIWFATCALGQVATPLEIVNESQLPRDASDAVQTGLPRLEIQCDAAQTILDSRCSRSFINRVFHLRFSIGPSIGSS